MVDIDLKRFEYIVKGYVNAINEEDAIDRLETILINDDAKPCSMSVGNLDVHYLREKKVL